MAKKMDIYEVTVPGYGTARAAARSGAQAKHDAFLSDAFSHMTYKEFLQMGVRAIKIREIPGPGDDGYDYIRQQYGVNVRIGDRIQLKNHGSRSGTIAEVIYPGETTACVHLDFGDYVGTVHPYDVERVK